MPRTPTILRVEAQPSHLVDALPKPRHPSQEPHRAYARPYDDLPERRRMQNELDDDNTPMNVHRIGYATHRQTILFHIERGMSLKTLNQIYGEDAVRFAVEREPI